MMLTCLSTYIDHLDGSMEFAHKRLPGLPKANRIC